MHRDIGIRGLTITGENCTFEDYLVTALIVVGIYEICVIQNAVIYDTVIQAAGHRVDTPHACVAD